MKREIISDALNRLDDKYISETAVFSPEAIQEASERKEAMNRRTFKHAPKRFVTILIAACLVMSLGVAAYAAWSIHQQRQDEIRQHLKIEENNVEIYTEPDVKNASAEGLNILSAVNDGESNKVFVNVSPVTAEELQHFPNELNFFWNIEGTERWGYAGPHISSTEPLSGENEIRDAVLSGAYDAESQTLTLVCYLDSSFLEKETEEKDHVMLSVSMNMAEEEIRSFGPAAYTPTEPEVRSFDFASLPYYSQELDKEIRLVALELTPFGAVWKTDYEGAQKYSEERNYEMMDQWNNMQDLVCAQTRIIFSDGEELCLGGALSCPYEDGTDNAYCGWNQSIDIYDIVRIELGDLVLWENK